MTSVADPTYPAENLMGWLATHSDAAKADAKDVMSSVTVVQTIESLQRHLTLPILADVASRASWEEFSEARVDVSILRDILTQFALTVRRRKDTPTLDPGMWTLLGHGLLGVFGPWIVVGDMALRRAGYGHCIRAYLRLIRRWEATSDFLMGMDERDRHDMQADEIQAREDAEQ